MDALKLIAADSMKAEVPSFKVGDTVKVRRSKLYYLRDRVGKAAKVKSQIG